jgi:hypothetical protein
MIHPLQTLAAVGVLVLVAPSVAAAQCQARLDQAAAAASALPASVDYRVPDQLSELHAEAEALLGSDEAGCLAVVQRMEQIIAANGGRGRAPGGASGAQGGASLPQVMPPTPFSRAIPNRTASLPAERAADVRALSEMVQATREIGTLTILRVAPTAPDAASDLAQSADQVIRAVEVVQDVLVNLPDDVEEAAGHIENQPVLVNETLDRMHAELEDGLRAMEEAEADFNEALDYPAQLGMTDEEASRAIHAANERWKRAREQTVRVQKRLSDWLANVNEYIRAGRQLETRHREELRQLEAQCDARNSSARTQLAQEYASGNRNSNAVADAIQDCVAVDRPVRQRHQREWEDLKLRFGRR